MIKWMMQKKVRLRLACAALAGLLVSSVPGSSMLVLAQTPEETAVVLETAGGAGDEIVPVTTSTGDGQDIQSGTDNTQTSNTQPGVQPDNMPQPGVQPDAMPDNVLNPAMQETPVLFGAAAEVYPGLSKDAWTECSDGKWRKLVDVPGMEIGQLSVGAYNYQHKPATVPQNMFYDAGSGSSAAGAAEVVRDVSGNQALQIKYSDNAPHNLIFKTDVKNLEDGAYELHFKYSSNNKTPNTTIAVQHNGKNISGKAYGVDGAENNAVNPIYSNTSDFVREGRLVFTKNAFQATGVLDIKMWSGASKNMQISIYKMELVAVLDSNPTPGLNKDTWTQGEDGRWRKIIDAPGMDISAYETGAYDFAHSFGSNPDPMPLNKFFDSGGNANTTAAGSSAEVIEENGVKGLKITCTDAGPHNPKFRIDVSELKAGLDLELHFKYTATGGNTLAVQKDGNVGITSMVYEGDVSTGDAKLNNQYSYAAGKSGEGKIVFAREQLGDVMVAKWWIGAKTQCTINKLELVAVSNTNPDELSGKQALIRSNDIVVFKNAGSFEDLAGVSDIWTGGSLAKEGVVTVTQEDKNSGAKSAKLEADSRLTLLVNELQAETEYSIFFAARPRDSGSKLEFRMSGFKNNQKFDYDNGNYNGGNWTDRDNMMNWVENLNIANHKVWSAFRYDFTTGSNASNSVRAVFNAVGGPVYVDDIYLVKRSDLDELHYKLPGNGELSRGSRALIDQGLQVTTWIPPKKVNGWMKQPSLEEIKEMGWTTVQYNDAPNYSKELHDEAAALNEELKWATAFGPKGSHVSPVYQDGSDGKLGSPTDEEWENGFLTEEQGLGNLDDLVSVCIGDEEDYSDTMTQNLKSWFEIYREHYDKAEGRATDIILHHNEVGNVPQENMKQISTFNKNMLRKYVQTAKPDMITYDMYYFREKRLDQTKGGTVIPFYDDLNRYRIVAGEGLDGSGEQPIPFGLYTYSWRTGPGAASLFKRGDGYYEMTQSQINLYTFATLAFGGKWIGNFRWLDDNDKYLFTDYKPNPDGSFNQYYLFDVYKEMIRQSKNLGPHLVRLTNEDVAIVRGQQMKDASPVSNDKPADNPDWADVRNTDMNARVHIQDVQVKNLGTQNDGLNGDVFISYFNQLPNLTAEDKNVFTCSDPKYFMILNGLTAGDGLPAELQYGSAYETRQEITITFSNIPEGAKLKKVSRVHNGEAGAVTDVALADGNKLVTTIGGGYADLYYWEEGTLNTNTSTKTADETGNEYLIQGDVKYAKEKNIMDLGGRTIVVGNIKGADDLAPENNMASNINTPAAADLVDGKTIKLSTYATPGGNIGAIGSRYYREDMWTLRVDDIEKSNNVKLEFREYDWTKEQLLQKLRDQKDGKEVADMPDLLIVPNDWLWSLDGLMANNAVYSMQEMKKSDGSQIFELDAEKWNQAYQDMTSRKGGTYSAISDPSTDAIGLFVRKTLLSKVDAVSSNGAGTGIYDLQRQDKWTFAELEKLIDAAIKNDIVSGGVKLFADNDYLIRELLVSAGVSQDPYEFDANSKGFREAVRIYQKLKDNHLLMEGDMNQFMEAFQKEKLIFLTAPYTETAHNFSGAYWYYEDNTERKTSDLGGVFGEMSYRGFKEADGDWMVTVRQRPAGQYEISGLDNWNFMLFPKADENSNYRAILNTPSYPLLLKGVQKPEEVAFVWNELCKEYQGLNPVEFVTKRGGLEYPDGRFWEGNGNFNQRDLDAMRKIALRDGYGDNLKASGLWDNVLKAAIAENPGDYDGINAKVTKYIADNQVKDPIYGNTTPDVPDTPDTPDVPDTPDKPDVPDTPDTPDKPDVPDTPDKPDTPDTPDKPDVPDTPDTPDKPDAPDTPDTPDKPDTPDTPDTPDKPDTPAQSGGSDNASQEIVTDWKEVQADVEAAVNNNQSSGKALNIVTGNNIAVTQDVLKTLKGKDATLALHTGNGLTFSLSGSEITDEARNGKLNLSVRQGTAVIPVSILNQKLNGTIDNRKISMINEDDFGMNVNMHLSMGAKNAGRYANLYRFDRQKGQMLYLGSFRITEKGQAMFGIRRGGEFLATVTQESPDEKVTIDGSYTVKKGDSLSQIAARSGMTLAQLIALNPQIKDINRIRLGQQIIIR